MPEKSESNQENDARQLLESTDSKIIGARVRRERIAQNVSIRDLAAKASISPHSITRLEAGEPFRASTLLKVCEALAIHVDRIASANDNEIAAIHRLADTRWHLLDGYADGANETPSEAERAELVQKTGQNPLVILKSRLESGTLLSTIIEVHTASPARAHPGEELVYCIRGPVQVTVADTAYRLETGESLTFWGTEMHSYEPLDGMIGQLLSVRARS